MRFPRRLVALAFVVSSSALCALWGCSTPDNHPPVIGDCSGNLCPPSQGQTSGSTSSGGSDGSIADSGGGGTTGDSGTTTDSGDLGDTGSPVDSGGGD